MTIAIGLSAPLEGQQCPPISRVVEWLLRQQNEDGGIPAGKPGDRSGCWTTAATIAAILGNGYNYEEVRNLVEFLLKKQYRDKVKYGSWPLILAYPASVLATADAVRSLVMVETRVISQISRQRIRVAISDGVKWLLEVYRPLEGAWSYSQDGRDQPDSLFATCSAVLAVSQTGNLTPNMRDEVRDYILECQDRTTGGWRSSKSLKADVNASDTARALVTLMEADLLPPSHGAIRKGFRYLRQQARRTIRTQKVSITSRRDAAETVVNNNTACDMLIAFSMGRRFADYGYSKCAHFLMSTIDNVRGYWELQDEEHSERISTWPTADWLISQAAMLGKWKVGYRTIQTLVALRLKAAKIGLLATGTALSSFVILTPNLAAQVLAPLETPLARSVASTVLFGIAASACWDIIKSIARSFRHKGGD